MNLPFQSNKATRAHAVRPYKNYDPCLGVKDALFTCKASLYAFAEQEPFVTGILPRGCGGVAIAPTIPPVGGR